MCLKNIFEDTRGTPKEIVADNFQFKLSTDALLLGLSVVLVIGLMIATAFLVWKVGAIHYNEYSIIICAIEKKPERVLLPDLLAASEP